ncbi:hypothetical protein SORBI_3010G064050 [Sorghum bicolor]|uniref:Secreted protein n=1 Tax=Sorghum bicolor TaxID=4558 RepID=A0A1W0VRQ6_SORBI|nr:hypothetical protein SORBI_3010G064050 [Sorghum bicolor]
MIRWLARALFFPLLLPRSPPAPAHCADDVVVNHKDRESVLVLINHVLLLQVWGVAWHCACTRMHAPTPTHPPTLALQQEQRVHVQLHVRPSCRGCPSLWSDLCSSTPPPSCNATHSPAEFNACPSITLVLYR